MRQSILTRSVRSRKARFELLESREMLSTLLFFDEIDASGSETGVTGPTVTDYFSETEISESFSGAATEVKFSTVITYALPGNPFGVSVGDRFTNTAVFDLDTIRDTISWISDDDYYVDKRLDPSFSLSLPIGNTVFREHDDFNYPDHPDLHVVDGKFAGLKMDMYLGQVGNYSEVMMYAKGTEFNFHDVSYNYTDLVIGKFEITPEQQPDIVATSLNWNTSTSTIDYTYEVKDVDLPLGTLGALYWSSNDTFDSGDELAIDHLFTIDTQRGTYSNSVSLSDLTGAPVWTSHLLLVVDPPSFSDPSGEVDEAYETNNVQPLIYEQPCIVFREQNSGIPGIDHVGFFPGGFTKVWESQGSFETGDFYDPTFGSTVPIVGGISGVFSQHTLGSFFHNSVDPDPGSSPVVGPPRPRLYIEHELARALAADISAVEGVGYLDFHGWVRTILGNPDIQKGATGRFTCIGLVEWAAERVGASGGSVGSLVRFGKEGFIKDYWETVVVPIPTYPYFQIISTLSPGLLHYALTHPMIDELNDLEILHAVFDPVDFILTDPLGRRIGYTEEHGRIDEIPDALYSGNGETEQLAIINPLEGTYSLELFGVGDEATAILGTPLGGKLFSALLENDERTTITFVAGNQPPVMDLINDRIAEEGELLSFLVGATDPDETDTLTFDLISAPSTATIDSSTGLFEWQPDDGPESVEVTVRVIDKNGAYDTATFSISVANVAPRASVSSLGYAVPGQPIMFEIRTADLSASDQSAGFSFIIDWNDGSPVETVHGLSGLDLLHTYASIGTYTIEVTATDKDGGISEVVRHTIDITIIDHYVSADSDTRAISINGSDGTDDQLLLTLGETLLSILINGQSYGFARADYDTISFDGGDGRDTAEVFASDADNYGEMSYKSGWITDGNVRVNLADAEIMTFHGGAGYDEVKMFDSLFNDVWTAERLSATMEARLLLSDVEPIYLNSADGFERILAVANREGRDKAILNDSPDVDFITMQPNDFAWMGLRSELYNEVAPILTYFIRAKDFEDVETNSTKGGADVVKFKDWNGADTLHAWPTHATMTNTANTYSFLASGFDYVQSIVYKQRSLGLDTAYLFGMDDANDTFVANGDTRYTVMKQDDVYAIVAKYFGKVYADTGSGNDRVKILDDPDMGNERLEAKDSDSVGWDKGYRWLRYSNWDSNAVLKFAYEVCKFETTTARSSNIMDKSEIDVAVDAWMTVLGTGGWKKKT